MVHGLANQLDGTFVLRSAPGKGTTATLWLPAADGLCEAPKAGAAEAETSTQRPLKVLAVDDDALIRMNIAAMLEDMGHDVFEASSGEQALQILGDHPDIELLITDQAMPGMTGTELIRHVEDQWPQLPIILATGYGEVPTSQRSRITKLAKPFDERELVRAVEGATNISPVPAGTL
jgi:CheY-like chemotaxis protein